MGPTTTPKIVRIGICDWTIRRQGWNQKDTSTDKL